MRKVKINPPEGAAGFIRGKENSDKDDISVRILIRPP